MRGLFLLYGLSAAIMLTGCQAREVETKTDVPAVVDASARPLSPEQINALAFRAAWGGSAPVTASDTSEFEPIEGSYAFREGVVEDLGAGLYALVSAGVGDGGAGAVAVHYLIRTEEGFRRNEADPTFISTGSGGDPEWSIRRDLTPSPAILVEARTTGQGRSCRTGTLVEMTPSHPLTRAEDVPLRVEGGDGGETAALEGQLARGHPGRDFTLQLSGASDARATYVLTDLGVYTATGLPGGLPGC